MSKFQLPSFEQSSMLKSKLLKITINYVVNSHSENTVMSNTKRVIRLVEGWK